LYKNASFFYEMKCHLCQKSSPDVCRLACGHHMHVACFQKHIRSYGHFECPKCNKSVACAHYDENSCEWYVGVEEMGNGVHYCYKIMADSKMIPHNGWCPKWCRSNGRL